MEMERERGRAVTTTTQQKRPIDKIRKKSKSKFQKTAAFNLIPALNSTLLLFSYGCAGW